MVYYIDILFLVNFVINYILLSVTAFIGRLPKKQWRIMLSAVLGAIYAVCIFFPDFSAIYSALFKITFSLFMLSVAYNLKSIRTFAKATGLFYLCTFIMGGGVFALFCFTDTGQKLGAVVSNGILYINLPWKLLFISVFASYIIIRLLYYAVRTGIARDNMLVKIKVFLNGKSVEMDALIDTGNALCEPLGGAPVIVAEFDALKAILPEGMEEEKIMAGGNPEGMEERIRIIPYSSIGKDNGILVGFRPDRISVTENEVTYIQEDVVVGICQGKISRDKSYRALLHPLILGGRK